MRTRERDHSHSNCENRPPAREKEELRLVGQRGDTRERRSNGQQGELPYGNLNRARWVPALQDFIATGFFFLRQLRVEIAGLDKPDSFVCSLLPLCLHAFSLFSAHTPPPLFHSCSLLFPRNTPRLLIVL